jgi:hypothetical protein
MSRPLPVSKDQSAIARSGGHVCSLLLNGSQSKRVRERYVLDTSGR